MKRAVSNVPWLKLALAGTLTTAAGVTLAAVNNTAHAATPANKSWHKGWARCFGVNAAYKNDCLTATGSCAGTDPKAHDPNAYVWMPAGVCKEVGGSATPGPGALKHIEKVMHLSHAKFEAIKAVPVEREAEIYYQSSAEFFHQAAEWAAKHH